MAEVMVVVEQLGSDQFDQLIANLGQVFDIFTPAPDRRDYVDKTDDAKCNVKGNIIVGICITEDEVKVDLVWLDHPATAKCRQVSAFTDRLIRCGKTVNLVEYRNRAFARK